MQVSKLVSHTLAWMSGSKDVQDVPREPAKNSDKYVPSGCPWTPGKAPEPSQAHGYVFQLNTDGSSQSIAPGAFPAGAVVNNKIVFHVNGIGTDVRMQVRDIKRTLLDPRETRDGSAYVGQPVVGIHEARDKRTSTSAWRVFRDATLLKSLQAGWTSPEKAAIRAYRIDPGVKVIHDQVQMAIERGHDVDIVSHSGGNAQTALALTLLSQEGNGRFGRDILQHVRVMAVSGVTTHHDFELASVASENILQVGSHLDPLYTLTREYCPPERQFPRLLARIGNVIDAASMVLNPRHPGAQAHDFDNVFIQAQKETPMGQRSRMVGFLRGEAGGLVELNVPPTTPDKPLWAGVSDFAPSPAPA